MKGGGKWSNRVMDDSDIERTSEYEEFLKKLQDFHDKRGTVLTTEPELGRKKLDLLKLYRKVTEAGGYDYCTTEKGAWRDLAHSYKLAVNNSNAGYLLKTIYYKNLAAYEILTFHGKEPPPKELVEDRSAAGGPIMTRTFENTPPEGSIGSETKNEEKSMSPATSSSQTNTRSLRQAPPQRQFYQPPAPTPRSSSKAAVTISQTQQQQHQHAQQNQHVQSNNVANMSSNQTAWTPPISVPPYFSGTPMGPVPRPVMTPSNNPQAYMSQRQMHTSTQRTPKLGTGHPGASLMMRITMGLRSGLSEEVGYALNNLVRISYEHGDSLKSDDYPGMTEALVQELSRLSDLELNGDTMDPPENRQQLDRILEAALILRNMSIQVDNAKYMAGLSLCRSTLVVGIGLPSSDGLTELKHYCLDIVEALSPWLELAENLKLYKGLTDGLDSDDRGVLIASLRGITRLVHKDERNHLKEIEPRLIRRTQDLLLLDDEELLLACLDFLYQYTAIDENVAALMNTPAALDFLKQLKRLLLYQAEEYFTEYNLKPRRKQQPPTQIPLLPQEVVQELLCFPEPERATKWMRCCFEEDPDADITQIALWQAYQARFTEFVLKGRPLLAAADFIKNVSVAFVHASAMVIPVPPNTQKFIIKGIKPRLTPLSLKGIEYLDCKWTVSNMGQYTRCPAQLPTPNDLFSHILDIHLTPPPTGTSPQPLVCQWAECHRFSPSGDNDRRKVIAHVRTHMPDRKSINRLPDENDSPFNKVVIRALRTAVDERGDATGVPLTSALVLRNVARLGHASEYLTALEHDIHEIAALNAPLSQYIYDILLEKYEEEDRRKATEQQ